LPPEHRVDRDLERNTRVGQHLALLGLAMRGQIGAVRHREAFNAVIDTTKVAVTVLRDVDVQFMLGGSMAAWVRGGPEPDNERPRADVRRRPAARPGARRG
jgi:hypothetical protein